MVAKLCAFARVDVRGYPRLRMDLLQETEHGPILPAGEQHSIRHTHDRNSYGFELLVCRRHAQAGARVTHRAGPAHADGVASNSTCAASTYFGSVGARTRV